MMETGDWERDIERLSRKQHGAFSREQALALGATSSSIGRRVRSGEWFRMAPGVYAHPAVRPTWERQLMAATLAQGGPSAVARGSAAALHGIEGFRRGRPTLVVPYGSTVNNPLARVHRTAHFDLVDRCRVSGIPVTTLARTSIDLSADLSERELGRMVDRSVLAGRLDLDHLVDRTAALVRPGWPGRKTLRQVLEERLDDYEPPHSELEAIMFDVLAAAGYPPPTRQLRLPWRTTRPGTADAGYIPQHGLLEADGRCWHTRVESFEIDHQRDLEAVAHRWTPLRVTYRQLQNGATLFVAAVGRLFVPF